MMLIRKVEKFALRELCRTLSIVVFILIALTPAKSQALGANRGDIVGSGGNRAVKGQIYLPSGDTKKTHFKVRLENTDSGTVSTVTDADGQFTFNGLIAGTFTIIVESTEEWESMRETIYIEPSGGSRINIIPFYLRRKPEIDPAFAGILKAVIESYNRGVEAAQKGDNKKAIEQLEKAVAADPGFSQAWCELGKVYLKQGALDQAAEALSTALKLKPDNPDINLNYGATLLQKKDFVRAEEFLRKALSRNGDVAAPHYYLGISLFNQKRLDEAQQELEKAVSLPGGANLALAHRYLGGLLWGKHQYKRAAEELEKYLTLSPKAADAQRTRDAIKSLKEKENK